MKQRISIIIFLYTVVLQAEKTEKAVNPTHQPFSNANKNQIQKISEEDDLFEGINTYQSPEYVWLNKYGIDIAEILYKNKAKNIAFPDIAQVYQDTTHEVFKVDNILLKMYLVAAIQGIIDGQPVLDNFTKINDQPVEAKDTKHTQDTFDQKALPISEHRRIDIGSLDIPPDHMDVLAWRLRDLIYENRSDAASVDMKSVADVDQHDQFHESHKQPNQIDLDVPSQVSAQKKDEIARLLNLVNNIYRDYQKKRKIRR